MLNLLVAIAVSQAVPTQPATKQITETEWMLQQCGYHHVPRTMIPYYRRQAIINYRYFCNLGRKQRKEELNHVKSLREEKPKP